MDYRERFPRLAACALCALVSRGVRADDVPGFDRPGIGISTGTMPAGSWDWEQGLPDFSRTSDQDVTQRDYVAGSHVRFGLTDRFEAQISVPLLLQRLSDVRGGHSTAGVGDVALGLKAGLPTAGLAQQAAVLLTLTAPTANDGLGAGHPTYSASLVGGWALGPTSLQVYANGGFFGGVPSWLLAPSWSFPITEALGAYVEMGEQFATHDSAAQTQVGAGLTFMARSTVQLDAYVLKQVSGPGSGLALGCGISKFFR